MSNETYVPSEGRVETERVGVTALAHGLDAERSNLSAAIQPVDRVAPNSSGRTQAKLPLLLRILVADDHEENRFIIERLLTLLGGTVHTVANGLQAVQALARNTYDVVLMDIHMPVLDGLSATIAIRSKEARTGGHTPILAYSACLLEEDHQRCLDAGMDAVLIKPTHLKDLTDALWKWSATARPASPAPGALPLPAACPTSDRAVLPRKDRLLDRCLGESRPA